LNDCCEEKEVVRKKTERKKKSSKRKKLKELKCLKRQGRKNWRKKKRAGNAEEQEQAFTKMMKAVRAHQDYLKLIKKDAKNSEAKKEQEKFIREPYRFAKNMLDPPNKCKATFGKKEADDHFQKTYHHEGREEKYEPPEGLPRPGLPGKQFRCTFATEKEFQDCLRKKSNGSAPGLNGVSYLVYKRCPRLAKKLYLLLSLIWTTRKIPTQWKVARVKLLPKSEDTSTPGVMRPISMVNVEGRIFWSLYQKQMAEYFIGNGYIDLRVQKGFLEKMAGCIEHATINWEVLKDAKDKRRQIVGIFLDLANAYGSVSHNMIQFALAWYHVPKEMAELLFNYYEGVCSQVREGDWVSEWFHGDIGVLQGCTASAIIFIVAFQLLLDIHEWKTRKLELGYKMSDANVWLEKPSYADDIELLAKTPKLLQESVCAFEEALTWSKTMKLKSKKCISFGFKQFQEDKRPRKTNRKKKDKVEYYKLENKSHSAFDPMIKVGGVQVICLGPTKHQCSSI
jgi:hypothetical protein